MPRRRGSPDRGTPSARRRRGAPPATRPEQADAAYKTRFRSVRFLEAGVLALLEHRKRGLPLGLLLRVAHLHDHRNGPDVAERILEFPVPLAPELVLKRHRGLRARGNCLMPELVDVLRVDVQVEGRPTCRDGRLRIATRELVRHHDERVADLNHRMHQGAVRHPLAGDFLRAERLLVELDRLCGSVDHEVRRNGSHPAWDGCGPSRARSLSRGCLLALPCSLGFARHLGTPPSWYRCRSDKADARTSTVSVLQPQTHQDFVYVGATDEHMASADALVLEAEGFVQAVCSRVRSEDGQFGFLEAASSHPFQDPLHQHAPEADPTPSIPNRDSDPTHVAGLRIRPCVAVRRSDGFPGCIRDKQDGPHAIEGAQPLPFVLEVRGHLVDQDVDFLTADEVHVPKERLRVAETGRPDDDAPAVLERDLFGPHRVGHGCHSGNLSSISGRRRSPLARNASICSFSWGVSSAYTSVKRVSIGGGGLRSTSLIVVWRRSSSSTRSLSSESFDHSPLSSRYFRIRSIGSRFAQVSTSSFDR